LTGAGVVELSPTLGLVGHDGWGDGLPFFACKAVGDVLLEI